MQRLCDEIWLKSTHVSRKPHSAAAKSQQPTRPGEPAVAGTITQVFDLELHVNAAPVCIDGHQQSMFIIVRDCDSSPHLHTAGHSHLSIR